MEKKRQVMRLLPFPKGNDEFHRIVLLWRAALDQLIFDALNVSTTREAIIARAEALEYFLTEEEELSLVCDNAYVHVDWVLNAIKYLKSEDIVYGKDDIERGP